MIRTRLWRIVAALLRGTGILDLWEKRDADLNNILRVLSYHRVATPNAQLALHRGDLHVTPQQFAWQMHYVAEHYEVLSVGRLLSLMRQGRPLPPGAILITFDDGTRDFKEHAWPVLQRLGLPALVFVPTAYPADSDARFWWDRLHASTECADKQSVEIAGLGRMSLGGSGPHHRLPRRLLRHIPTLHPRQIDSLVGQIERTFGGAAQIPRTSLRWDELRQLCSDGLTLGNHTRHHVAATAVSEDEWRAEVLAAQADLEREVGHAWPIFCYPYGHVSPVAERVLEQEGFSLAFTTISGLNKWPLVSPLHLKRTNVGPSDTLDLFRLRMTTTYRRYKQFRRHGFLGRQKSLDR